MKIESNNPSTCLRERGDIDVVLLAVVCQDEILECDLNLDPLVICQSWPDVVRLRDRGLVRLQDDLGSVVVHMEGPEKFV